MLNLEQYRKEFWSLVNKDGPMMQGMSDKCWQWMGKNTGHYEQPHVRYGTFTVRVDEKPITMSAHTFAWLLCDGPKSSVKFPLHHSCKNSLCVNPNHLEMITVKRHRILHVLEGGYNA